jgi:hypothetical protein
MNYKLPCIQSLITTAVLSVLVLAPLKAKEVKYRVSDIPKELKENARSVIRQDQEEFEVKSTNNAVFRITYAITVLNKNGIDDAIFTQSYDKFRKVSSISGKVYDENGEMVKRIPSDEILDHSAISGYSIYDDSRIKYIDPKYRTIPFTVEYTYEITFNSFYTYPIWNPIEDYNISVEKSSFKIISPKSLSFNYKERNIATKAAITSNSDRNIYYWEVFNQKALIAEPYSPSYLEFTPIVLSVPNEFEFGGYKCTLKDWQNLGEWRCKLGENRNILSDETIHYILKLTSGEQNDYDKIRKIYEFMQAKTRYVNVTKGIGGLQPIEAATVDRLSYGDCKALSNYMQSLLDVIGIKSNIIWAHAGNSMININTDIPFDNTNHEFLCVPLKDDTLWLECTNQRIPCGYIGDFTDDRDVLLIDKNNSKIVHTKSYSALDNTESRKTMVKFTSANGGEAAINANYKGCLGYEEIAPIYYSDDADKKKILSNRISLPGFQLRNFAYKENKAIIPSFDETLNISFQNYGTIAGQRVFIPLNFINRFESNPERVRNRKTDVIIRRPYIERDTVIYELPANSKVEVLPNPIEIATQFGTYKAKAEIINNKLVYTRFFQMNKGKYPPTAYADLLDFYEKISNADRVQCSLTL